MQTPPSSPQRFQQRTRQILREINASQDSSPHRRRVPSRSHASIYPDENHPPSPRPTSPTPEEGTNARSRAQKERRRRERLEREGEPPRVRQRKHPPRPDPEGPFNARQLAQRERRDRERAAKENCTPGLALSPPSQSQRTRTQTSGSRVLQAISNGLLTPPTTQAQGGSRNGETQHREPEHENQRGRAPADHRPRAPRVPASGSLMAARREYRDPQVRHDLGPMNVVCRDCKALHWIDERVSSSSTHAPEFGMCCNHGKVQLDLLQEPPEPLLRLLVGDDAQAQEFRSHITQYNTALAFTSLGVKDDKNINRHGPNAWVTTLSSTSAAFPPTSIRTTRPSTSMRSSISPLRRLPTTHFQYGACSPTLHAGKKGSSCQRKACGRRRPTYRRRA
ncbi:hypothetical protein B0H11DRAFT_1276887 [Mycena galericulata]|nr:hypothetical protein B0H11DRAFT_1276887 [Mycena galericulata]